MAAAATRHARLMLETVAGAGHGGTSSENPLLRALHGFLLDAPPEDAASAEEDAAPAMFDEGGGQAMKDVRVERFRRRSTFQSRGGHALLPALARSRNAIAAERAPENI